MCAYKSDIPKPTDQISVSQGDLYNNFQQLNTAFLINHNDWNGANAGKHKQVTMMNAGTPSFANTEYALYNNGTNLNLFNGPANKTAVVSGSGSYSGSAMTGWTYLTNGLVIKWGLTAVTGAADGYRQQTVVIHVGPGNYSVAPCYATVSFATEDVDPATNYLSNTSVIYTTGTNSTNIFVKYYYNVFGNLTGKLFILWQTIGII